MNKSVSCCVCIILQITGACLGALCAKYIAAPGTYAAVKGGINVVQADVSQSQALLGEFLATMLRESVL